MAEVVDQCEVQSAGERQAPTVYHIPVCPFPQRLEILLTLKGCRHLVDFHVVDITRPYPGWLLEKTRGTTALPVLESGVAGLSRRVWLSSATSKTSSLSPPWPSATPTGTQSRA